MTEPVPVGAGQACLCSAAFSPGGVLGLVGERGAIRTEARLLTCAVRSCSPPPGTGTRQAAAQGGDCSEDGDSGKGKYTQRHTQSTHKGPSTYRAVSETAVERDSSGWEVGPSVRGLLHSTRNHVLPRNPRKS